MEIIIKNLKDLDIFAELFAKELKSGDVVNLIGDLGAGKTTFVQSIGKFFNISDLISSPTFSIVNIYEGDFRVNHLDLYRLNDPSEIEALDFETYFYPEGITFIEWGEKAKDYLPEDMIELKIEDFGEGRRIEFLTDNGKSKEMGEIIYENFSA